MCCCVLLSIPQMGHFFVNVEQIGLIGLYQFDQVLEHTRLLIKCLGLSRRLTEHEHRKGMLDETKL